MTWTIDGIKVQHVADDQLPTLTRGDEVTLPLLFEHRGETQVIEARDSRYSLQYSFNYEGPEARLPFEINYDNILDLIAYRGEDVVRYGVGDRGEPWYRERLPPDAPVDSLVVPVDAPDDIAEDRSHWGIVVDGEDRTNPVSSQRRVDLTLFVLAERDAYETRADVEAAFGDEITI